MKYTNIFCIGLLFIGCSSTQLMDTWRNPDYETYTPNKVLVIGITSNTEARQKFEDQLKNELVLRGTDATTSLEFFGPNFGADKKTEEQLTVLEDSLLRHGFDTILLTKIVGIEDKVAYNKNYKDSEETYRKFREDYIMHQDIYNNPEYYQEYTVYHAETSMYCICPTEDRDLIWKGYIDIIDPQSTDETVNDYIKLITLVLEEELLIMPIYEENDRSVEVIN